MSDAHASFVGTWRLLSAVVHPNAPQGGDVAYPYGERPYGQIIYDAAGHMSAILFSPDRPAFAGDDFRGGTPEETQAAFRGMVAYYGTYSVDEEKGIVTHHLEGSYFPNWEGGDQPRYFSFEGERLTLSTPPMPFRGGTGVFTLVWQRVA